MILLAMVRMCCVGAWLLAGDLPAQSAVASAPKPLVDTGSREWNQPRGGPAGTSACDVAPITSAPIQAWKASFKSIEGEPVSWGGIVYAVATVPEAHGRRLVAIDLKSGKPAAKPVPVPDGFVPILAVWQGMVALLGGKEMTFYSQRGDQMVLREKKVAGTWPSAPCIYEGYLFAVDDRGVLHCVDMPATKEIGWVSAGHGQPAVAPGPKEGEIVVATTGFAGSALLLHTALVSGLGTKAFRMVDKGSETGALLESEVPKFNSAYVANMPRIAGRVDDIWFVYSPERILSQGKLDCHTIMWGTHNISPIDGQAAIQGDFACGFASDGALISFFTSGKHARVVPEGTALPAGTHPGPATIARGVIYLGNWAVELDGKRVLWCDPSIEAVSPLLPVADGTIVYASAKGELVCLKDPKLAPASSAPTLAASAREAPKEIAIKPGRTPPPGGGDGVVLASGKWVAGKIAMLEQGRLSVKPDKGSALDFDAANVALIEDGASVRLIGAEDAVYSAFWSVLRAEWLDGLEHCFAEFRDTGFPEECQRVLSLARDSGMEESRAAELSRSLTGTSSNRHDNADKQRAKIHADEQEARERCAAACVRAADWCREHAISTAASVLLARADDMRPGQKIVIDKAAALIPRGFPEAESADAARRWMQLAQAILPVAGELVPPGDPDWARVKSAPWDQGAFGVRTANVLLFSRERDALTVGNCLRHGERTVRVLQTLLGRSGDEKRDAETPRRLDVRLHKNRAEYLAELGDNARAMEWTAGYYSPVENIARFYVPHDQLNNDPLERNLEHVLIHELTHQYISDRWLRTAERGLRTAEHGKDGADEGARGSMARGGFWVVEGFARFIEDQVAEIDRRGERFDDETVASLDAACRVSAAGKLFPLDKLLELSQQSFHGLGEKPLAVVQLRNTVVRIPVTEKEIFYEEGGSLVFYLMNKAGPERRARLIEYLKAWYDSRLEPHSWESLGYASSTELETAFMGFLRDVALR